MSSHSGTIGRKRGGSASEYYFGGGSDQIRRQRSAEWHSHHAYSSSEDEYQNTTQPSAFDTQLLAQLLLQSQQLASLDQYGPDCEHPNISTAVLNNYANTLRNHSPGGAFHMQMQQQNTGLCSPIKQQTGITGNTEGSHNSVTNKYQTNQASLSAALLANHLSTSRNTNPFLNAKYDSQSNSDSMSDRVSYSGSAAMLDRLQAAVEGATSLPISGNGASALSALNSSLHMPTSSTASSLNPSARESTSSGGGSRTPRTKNGRALSRAAVTNSSCGGAASGMTPSSSGASSNGNALSVAATAATTAGTIAASIIGRSDREKLKLQQIQKELREYAHSTAESSIIMDLDEIAISGGESEPPPDPAPPEIPPRTQSLLMSLRKHSDYKLKYDDKGDQKHEEFIPTNQMQQQQTLQKEFLLTDNSRSSENQSKSSDTQSQAG
ncbi:serine-rich adhesin for platelets-like [Eurosta solidaginis]|uniref:serine-rich adhesin for platelets-like n=1 Tax=Eurosta solidaginis TaxID=178769 RepID=UPI003531265A